MGKERIDVLMVTLGYASSREEAKRYIMAGKVFIDTNCIDKPGTKVPVDAHLVVKGNNSPYVSRGGLKLAKALSVFPVDLKDKIVLDVGSSTGGFTDCSLQNGAKMVYSVDVGYGQLAWKLRQDARVRVMERVNFRYSKPEDFDPRPEVGVMDVSFISMTKLLDSLREILLPSSSFIGLIKPQFEAGPDKVGKGGIVRDPQVHREVLHKVIGSFREHNFQVCGVVPSPIRGGDGNIEYLIFANTGVSSTLCDVTEQMLDEQVKIAQTDESHVL